MARIFPSRLQGSAPMETKSIATIQRTIMRSIHLNPSYQREFCWTQKQCNDFIETIMFSGIVPPCIIYKYQEHEGAQTEYECVDGHHRLSVMRAFFRGEPIVQGKKDMMVSLPYKTEEGTIHLFYNKNENTIQWQAENGVAVDYFTDDEKQQFRDFGIDIKTIMAYQSEDQRRELFVSLSKGTPLRGCDVKKNYHNIPLIAVIKGMGWEIPFRTVIRDHCHKKAERFWLHWLVRMFLLSKSPLSSEAAKSDSTMNSYIQHDVPHTDLEYTEEQIELFKNTVQRFLAFRFSPQGKPIRISPTMFFALYVQLRNSERVRPLEIFIEDWSPEVKERRRFWMSGTDVEARRTYFNELDAKLSSIAPVVAEHADVTEYGEDAEHADVTEHADEPVDEAVQQRLYATTVRIVTGNINC